MPKDKEIPLPTEVEDIKRKLEQLPEDSRVEVLSRFTPIEVTSEVTSVHRGPLPPPESFRGYEEILPGAAERILVIAEKEQQIRHEGQKGAIFNDRLRILSSWTTSIGLLVLCGFIAFGTGQVIASLPFGLAGSLVAMFRLWLRYKERQQEQEKISKND